MDNIFFSTELKEMLIMISLNPKGKNKKTGGNREIDDKTVSNNGDSEKVLATVVATVYAFSDKYPDSWIFATGSTKARTRLYRMGITRYIDEIKKILRFLV